MKKRRDELELLLLKNKQSNENAKAFLIIVDMVGFIAGLLLYLLSPQTIAQRRWDMKFNAYRRRHMPYLQLDAEIKKCKYFVLFSILLFIIFLLLCNVEGWNEGNMAGSYYYADFFKPTSDALCLLLLISTFLFFIPIALYVSFLHFLSRATYYLLNYDKFKAKNQENTKEL